MTQLLPGVYTTKQKNGSISYRSSLTHKSKHISLGSYDNAAAAHTAYLLAKELLGDSSRTLTEYSPASVLPFDKWVCLINLRDNGLYIATPIYIRPQFFYYYFSPDQFFLFDLEDLFYYSSHRICVRGGHYFVADYGMQVNIMTRYGIKNYAVEGRDYRFRNGNNHDYRYENLEIINRYYGVSKIQNGSSVQYQVKIHVKGNLRVGIYPTETEAAIAYNKAIDLLKKAGVTKNYVPNYLENLSPAVYADIYSSLSVAPGILNYRSE